MNNILIKPIEQISVDDLNDLVEQKVSENEQVEFKGALPSDDNNDPWLEKQNDIGRYAKKVILEEVVALANAFGGILLVGIEESKEEEKVAGSIRPLPNCEDLANRFNMIFRDCVEPVLPALEVRGVQTNAQAGVLMVRVGKSRNAPHRVKLSRRCTVRRQDRCEELSMMEIQDLALNTVRGLERIREKFMERKSGFLKEFDHIYDSNHAFGVRITGVPVLEHKYVEKIFVDGKIDTKFARPIHAIHRINDQHSQLNDVSKSLSEIYEPVLRGARVEKDTPYSTPAEFTYGEIYCDGLIELGYLSVGDVYENEDVHPDLLIGQFAHLLLWIEKFRKGSFSIGCEYAIEVEFHVREASVSLGSNHTFLSRMAEDGSIENTIFPTYSFGTSTSLEQCVALFQRDLFNSVGWHVDRKNETFVVEREDQ